MIKRIKIFFLFLFIITLPIFSQNKFEELKNQAVVLMNDGKYSEAIDNLNKYIEANPSVADGYQKRGLCYEQKSEYQFSVLDLRRAVRLDPIKTEIKKDLDRVTEIWYKQLYQKIDNYTQEITRDQNNASNYLEIGKSYFFLEEWRKAENWYDEYLKRNDNALPEEILHYTEILVKTGSIIKGEIILKKYTVRYPNDWVIWSRYGYFTLWLGKYKIAEDAFKTSLELKPSFKEAQEGLDLVKNKSQLTQEITPLAGQTENQNPIQKLYRLVNENPENDTIRFNLVNELIANNRYEEAYQQLQYLQPKHNDENLFQRIWKNVTDYRDTTFNNNVEKYTAAIKENPSNKEAVMKLSESYANLFYYGSAIEVLKEYLQDIPEDQDLDARFKYAQYSAWNYEWDKAIVQVDKLLKYDQNNFDYQLLRGQIGVQTVQNLDLSEKYLLNVLEARPQDLSLLLSLSSLYSWKDNYKEAKKYLDMAQQIAPHNPEVEKALSNYEIHMGSIDGQDILAIRDQAVKLSDEGKCEDALRKYDEFLSKRKVLTRDEMLEYAAIASCAQEYTFAIEYYDKVLKNGYDSKVALYRAKNYYLNHDTTKALRELENISKLNPEDYDTKIILADTYTLTNQLEKSEIIYRELKSGKNIDTLQQDLLNQKMVFLGKYYAKNKNFDKAEKILGEMDKEITNQDTRKDLRTCQLFLGDSYVIAGNYSDAKNTYQNLLIKTQDTSEFRIVKERISWLPRSGLSSSLSSIGNFFSFFFPTKLGLKPLSAFYGDNQNFRLYNYGGQFEFGFTENLLLGVIWSNTILENPIISRNLTQYKGTAEVLFLKDFNLSGSYGVLKIEGESDRKIGNIKLLFESENNLAIELSYENNDARTFLSTPDLINIRMNANYFRFSGLFNYNRIYGISGFYNYFRFGDENEGNDVQFRLGKKFILNGFFGYEFYFSDYAFTSPSYYSPQNFISHSIWGELNWEFKKLKLKAGGKIGYVPKVDFIINEIYADAIYNPTLKLTLSAHLGLGNNARYDSSYKNITASLLASWGIF